MWPAPGHVARKWDPVSGDMRKNDSLKRKERIRKIATSFR